MTRAYRPAGKATITDDLQLERSHVLRSSRHYLRAPNQGHHITDRLEERGVQSGGARRSPLRGGERSNVIQTSVGTVSNATVAKLLRDGVELYRARKHHLELLLQSVSRVLLLQSVLRVLML